MLKDRTVAVLGAGTMGQAIVKGLVVRTGLPQERIRATVKHAERAAGVAEVLGIVVGTDNAAAVSGADVVVISTKPRDLLTLLERLREAGSLDHRPLIVSIAAGVRIGAIEAALPPDSRVVRAMPNTPCVVGEGMVVLSPGAAATGADLETTRALFAPLGRCRVLDEEHLDTVTGLSGSGPAFVYVVIEALSEGGVMMGLPRAVATELAAQTVAGAARMVLETGRHPASLKDDVTTPAGCTIAGLLAMEDGRIRSVLARTVEVAARAAAGLGGPRAR